MAKNVCKECGKKINKIMSPKGFRCPIYNLIFCKECSPLIGGLLIKIMGCPECGTRLASI